MKQKMAYTLFYKHIVFWVNVSIHMDFLILASYYACNNAWIVGST